MSNLDIWAMDQPAIWDMVRQRNALRQAALLPLLDEQKEFDQACMVLRDQRWRAFRASKQADSDRICDQLVAERGRIRSWSHSMGWYREFNQRFQVFLHANYADEIAALEHIAPDYLKITRRVTDRLDD